ncbi:MAG: ATP-binding protein, partial [Comamonas sp.]
FSYSPLHDGSGTVAGMYCTVMETTARVQAERRAALELKLSDALHPLGTPDEVLATAGALLGQELGLCRATYAEVDDTSRAFTVRHQWNANGAHELSRPVYPLDGFGPTLAALMRAGETLVVDDVETDPRCAQCREIFRAEGAAAVLTVPVMRSGRLAGFLSLDRDQPYHWLEADVRFTRETAERTWGALETARAQAELRAERDRARYIFDTMVEGFALLAPDWTILSMNAEGLRIVNKPAGEVIGSNHWALFPEVVNSEAGQMLRRVMEERQAGAIEYRLPEVAGRRGWNEVRAFPTQEGGIAIFFREITSRKRAEEGLRLADQRKDEFLAMLAHELRNPLAPIRNAVSILQLEPAPSTTVRTSRDMIDRQLSHLTRLVDDLLDAGRLTSGKIRIKPQLISFHRVVARAIEATRPAMDARSHQFKLLVPPEDLWVNADETRLAQVLQNLLSNATKFTPVGGEITLAARVESERLYVDVEDNGEGISPLAINNIFELFSQGDGLAASRQSGLGIGLSLARSLVEMHGGSISARSPGTGQGSVFSFELPGAILKTGLPDNDNPDLRSSLAVCMLVVDDNRDAADSLAEILRLLGYRVSTAYDGRTALETAIREKPSAVFLDIGMPDMDGPTVLRAIRALPGGDAIYATAVTGYGVEDERVDRPDFTGFDARLLKPVALEDLQKLLITARL